MIQGASTWGVRNFDYKAALEVRSQDVTLHEFPRAGVSEESSP